MEGKPELFTLVMAAGLLLVLALGMAAVPLMIKVVVDFQLRIGNGEHPVVRFFDSHRWQITYGVWAFFLLGLAIALPTMIKDGFFTLPPDGPTNERTAAPKGAMPPLEYQVRHAAQILLCRTDIRGGAVRYVVVEVMKRARPVVAADVGYTLELNTYGFELLGYRPEHGVPVVLFFTEPDSTGKTLFELLVSRGETMTYPSYQAPYDPAIFKVLTRDELRRMIASGTG
ncbi:MAG: hypothetical protein ACREUO_10375 [Burkholderiales bacterium]